MSRQSTTPPVWDAKHLRIATDAARIALWSWNVDTDEIALDERSHVLWGLPLQDGFVTFDVGIIGRIMFGVFLDVTERKIAEEGRELLSGEMSHRVKNLFAIASALTHIASRSATTTVEMARDITGGCPR